ncbi:hypothetical protein GCM10010266_58790 [Streptomyces griseomycini]|uniref:hypothetical protein n=1 Tax=Streptomyces griseomycini TaxID=66895 RepID=UPI0019CBF005|nr:hypothetical protein GCM10010266_58790 [Streptomyces griseomycini]
MHLIDGRPTGHLAWGDGGLPLSDCLRALERQGHDGWMVFELFGDGTCALDPRAAVERCGAAVGRPRVRRGRPARAGTVAFGSSGAQVSQTSSTRRIGRGR